MNDLYAEAEKLADLAISQGEIEPWEREQFIERYIERMINYPAANDETTRARLLQPVPR